MIEKLDTVNSVHCFDFIQEKNNRDIVTKINEIIEKINELDNKVNNT